MQFPLFVYGTLKQGERNFERYCRGVRSIEPATVLGRLYHLPYGYPMLDVPQEHVLATGTADYARDAEMLAELEQRSRKPGSDPGGDWVAICGEILTFDDPLELGRLAGLDALENFRPGETSLYRRVIVRLLSPDRLVWTYVAAGRLPPGAVRIENRWTGTH